MSEIENILLRDLYKDLPEAPVVERQGLGAMTGRGTVTTQQDTQQRDISPAQSSVAEYMKKIIQKQIQDGASISAAAQDVPFDPAIDNMETLSARGYDSDDVLRSSVATGAVSATKQKNVRRDVMEQAERMIQEMQQERTPVREQEIQDYLTGVDIDKAQGNLEDSVLETISGILGVPVPPKDTTTEDDSVTIEDAPDADVVLDEPTPVLEGSIPMEGMSAQAEGFFNKSVSEAFNIVNDKVGMTKDEWSAFKKEVAKIESGGKKDPYRIKGGANDHYDGKYQMGKLAKLDAADLLGMNIGHSKEDRESFRNTPSLQEKAFAAFTAKNHNTLMKKSDIYKNLSKKQQTAVLGYAHNQGATAASKWLASGKVGSDKFKTKGTKYSDAIASTLGVTLPNFGSSAPLTSLRPKARPDTRVASN